VEGAQKSFSAKSFQAEKIAAKKISLSLKEFPANKPVKKSSPGIPSKK
jgi:hypothetical protein